MKPWELFKLIEDTEYISGGDDVQFAVKPVEEEKVIYLLFQESTSKRDWQVNLDFPVKVYKQQQKFFLVHRGWAKAWKSINDMVFTELLKVIQGKEDWKIIVAGWSYGGAMSLLAAEDYFFRFNKPVTEVITFGGPKPLFGFYTRHYFKKAAEKFYQYEFSYDFVTWCVPLPFYMRCGNNIIDKKNCWKLWRVFQTGKWHCAYGDAEYY